MRDSPEIDAALWAAVAERGLLDGETLDALHAIQLEATAAGGDAPSLASILLQSGAIDGDALATLIGELDRALSAEAPAVEQIGRYDILGKLGQGGVGIVYRALDRDLKREVALKVLRPVELGEAQLARFHREGALAASLEHPGIIRVHEIGVANAASGELLHYMAMQLVDGDDFADAQPRLTRGERIEVLAQVAEAVGAAHAAGIVHRDLKPSNVLLDGDGAAVVTDFGLAQSLTSDVARLTRSGAAIGTPYFMSPEQALGQRARIGPPSDVWALGVMLFEALSDELPFGGQTVLQVFDAVMRSDPQLPADREVPGALRTVIERALAKDPAARYPDAGAFARDLRHWQRGEKIEARALGAGERLGRMLNRGSGIVCAAVAGGCLLAIAGLQLLDHALDLAARDALARELGARVRERLVQQLAPAERALTALTRRAGRAEIPLARGPWRERAPTDDPLIVEMTEIIVERPTLSWVSFSSVDGDMIGVYRVPGHPALRLHASWPDGATVRARSHIHRPDGSWAVADDPPFVYGEDYDPRLRSYYKTGVAAGGTPRWTEPYVFWGSYPGISRVVAVSEGGALAGVMTADLEIWQLSQALEGLTAGAILLTTGDRRVIGHSNRALLSSPAELSIGKGYDARLRYLHELACPLTRTALASPGGRSIAPGASALFRDPHQRRHLISAQQLEVSGLALMTIALIPEDEWRARRQLHGALTAATWAAVGLAVAALAIGLRSAGR